MKNAFPVKLNIRMKNREWKIVHVFLDVDSMYVWIQSVMQWKESNLICS